MRPSCIGAALCLVLLTALPQRASTSFVKPMRGWMTWERFRCTAGASGTGPSCASDPDNCISAKLVEQHADILAQPEWKAADKIVGGELLRLHSTPSCCGGVHEV